MDIKALAQDAAPYVVERRHYYHQHPELTGEEKNTRDAIHRDLEALGITDIRDMVNCYGLVATIHGGKPGKTVGLRADTDALSFQEETGLPFAPANRGKCTPAATIPTLPCCWAPPSSFRSTGRSCGAMCGSSSSRRRSTSSALRL